MKVGVVTFPGSNCDADALHAVAIVGLEPIRLWHKDTSLTLGLDAIILPGGFSYGDYLRTGSIARFSPIMNEVIAFANAGGPVLGICNGFQILTEAGLLCGALLRNTGLNFVCKDVLLRVERNDTTFTCAYSEGQVIRVPIAHGEGCFVASEKDLKALEEEGRVVFRYVDSKGKASAESNPNGSISNIAGICNVAGNVVGLMPHPERAAEVLLGSDDGIGVFNSIIRAFSRNHATIVQ